MSRIRAPYLVEPGKLPKLILSCALNKPEFICSPDGRPLCAVVKIIPNDTLPFPSNLDVISIWVVDGFKVWESELTKLETPYGSNVLVKMAGGGPKWPPGRKVDILVQLISIQENISYYLKNEDIEISSSW